MPKKAFLLALTWSIIAFGGLANAQTTSATISGNILDGQELLVDYTFDVGGTYANAQLDQNVDLSFNLSRRADIYLRYGESMPRVTSGVPASPLNTVRSTLYGVRAEMPMKYPMDLVLGGFLERENRRETIAPYVRTAGEVFVQGEVPFEARVDVRAAARRTRVTADNLLQNVDLTGYDLSLGWRHGSGLGVSANAVFERDTGGLVMRERKAGTLRAQWRFRQLALTADLSRTHESQGSFARERTVGHLVLRRDF